MSPVGDGENRNLSVVDCGDEFRRIIAKSNGTRNAAGFETQSTPPDDDSSDDDSYGPVVLPVLWAAEHTLDEIA